MPSRRRMSIAIVGLLVVSCALSGARAKNSTQEKEARRILDATGVKGGLIVHLGCGDGKLTAALRRNDRYLVHGLGENAADIDQARIYIRSLGLYGKISVDRFDGQRLPYGDNLANLVVADTLGDVPLAEVMRVLVPRGVAYVMQTGEWTKFVKPWPETIDEWTHWLHDASGNAVARDQLVGPPRHLQWAAKPLWQRHHDTVPSTTAMVSSSGRLFYISDEAPACLDGSVPDKWFLVARDAFNGVLLWKRSIPQWGWSQWSSDWPGRFNEPPHLPKRLVAADDRVYVTLNFNGPLTALDAATGEVIRQYEGTENTDEILYRDGLASHTAGSLLILSLNQETRTPTKDDKAPLKKSVCVLEADSGRIRWKKGSYSGLRGKFNSVEPFSRLELTVGGDQVFLVDTDAILSLDLTSGEQRWRIPRPQIQEHLIGYGIRMSDMCVLLYHDGVLLFAQPQMEKKRSWHSLPGTLYAYHAEDGELLWKHRYGGWSHNWQPDVFAIAGLVWVHEHQDVAMKGHDIANKEPIAYAVIGLDLMTGEVKRRFSTKETFNVGHHHRCYRNKATERFLLASRRGVEFLDLASGENYLHHWARGACLHGVVPCNGLLYLTPHPCDCYIATKLNGYFALAPEFTQRAPARGKEAAGEWFEMGPAYGEVKTQPSVSCTDDPDAWPMFRHDALRSGSTQTPVPASLDVRWRTAVGGQLSPAVVADERLFVASVDEHRVTALDAVSGETIWNFTAGGRVDTPPTIYKGLALFGSADGWVYCLRAVDGRLVWRRRAAPRERLVGAFGQLESAWPVHGSILVKDDVAYLAAGRSSYLDGGIHLYALDPITGDVFGKQVLYSPDPETGKMPPGDAKTIPGVLADILVSDGSSVYMRQEKVFSHGFDEGPHLLATGGFRDESWFNRTKWTMGAVAQAQLLVFDERAAYGIQAYPSIKRSNFFHPGDKGYLLFAAQWKSPSSRKLSAGGRPKSSKKRLAELWSMRAAVHVTAMVLTEETLFIAGPPDVVPRDDPLAAFENRKGAELWVVSAVDGKKLTQYDLDSPPVFDGMAAARGKLYLSLKDGSVVCLDGT